jgi:hypothetical protein
LIDDLPAAANIPEARPPLTHRRRPGWIRLIPSHKTALGRNLQHCLTRNEIPEDELARGGAFLLAHSSHSQAFGFGLNSLQRRMGKDL